MARMIAVANQKGGAGKTSTAVNVSGYLAARHKKKTLLVDIDPQSHASLHLGVNPPTLEVPTVYDVLVSGTPPGEAILKTMVPGLDLLPGHLDLAGAEIELVNTFGRESLLRDALTQIKSRYDFILVDCPPSLSLLTVNALVASREVLITVEAEFFALQGLSGLVRTIDLVRAKLNPKLIIAGVVLTKYDGRLNLARDVEAILEANDSFKGKILGRIRRNVRLAESPSHSLPISLYAPNSRGAHDYMALTKEVLRAEKVRHGKGR